MVTFVNFVNTHLIFSVQILVSLVRYRVVRISHICAVFPVHNSAFNMKKCVRRKNFFPSVSAFTWVLLDSSGLVGRVFVFWDPGPVHISLNISVSSIKMSKNSSLQPLDNWQPRLAGKTWLSAPYIPSPSKYSWKLRNYIYMQIYENYFSPVFQFWKALAGKIGINRSCKYQQVVLRQIVFDPKDWIISKNIIWLEILLEVVHAKSDSDLLVLQKNIFKHCSVAILG